MSDLYILPSKLFCGGTKGGSGLQKIYSAWSYSSLSIFSHGQENREINSSVPLNHSLDNLPSISTPSPLNLARRCNFLSRTLSPSSRTHKNFPSGLCVLYCLSLLFISPVYPILRFPEFIFPKSYIIIVSKRFISIFSPTSITSRY